MLSIGLCPLDVWLPYLTFVLGTCTKILQRSGPKLENTWCANFHYVECEVQPLQRQRPRLRSHRVQICMKCEVSSHNLLVSTRCLKDANMIEGLHLNLKFKLRCSQLSSSFLYHSSPLSLCLSLSVFERFAHVIFVLKDKFGN